MKDALEWMCTQKQSWSIDWKPRGGTSSGIRDFSYVDQKPVPAVEMDGRQRRNAYRNGSTGVYWKPIYNILGDYFDIPIANAQRIKNVPGRKTDVTDAEWIAKLLRHGLIEKSFVPPTDIWELPDLIRLRKKWIRHLTSEKNRIQKVLECSISNWVRSFLMYSVFPEENCSSGWSNKATSIWRMWRQGFMGDWLTEKQMITDSLFGTLNDHQRFLIQQSWNHIEYLEKAIAGSRTAN